MSVGQQDALQVLCLPPHAFHLPQYQPRVRVVEGVDQDQTIVALQQKGVYVAALPLPHGVDPGRDLRYSAPPWLAQSRSYLSVVLAGPVSQPGPLGPVSAHGKKAFSMPSSEGRRPG